MARDRVALLDGGRRKSVCDSRRRMQTSVFPTNPGTGISRCSTTTTARFRHDRYTRWVPPRPISWFRDGVAVQSAQGRALIAPDHGVGGHGTVFSSALGIPGGRNPTWGARRRPLLAYPLSRTLASGPVDFDQIVFAIAHCRLMAVRRRPDAAAITTIRQR